MAASYQPFPRVINSSGGGNITNRGIPALTNPPAPTNAVPNLGNAALANNIEEHNMQNLRQSVIGTTLVAVAVVIETLSTGLLSAQEQAQDRLGDTALPRRRRNKLSRSVCCRGFDRYNKEAHAQG